MIANLSAATLAELDYGIGGKVIDAEIAKAIAFLHDRGKDGAKVKVKILLTIQQDGESYIPSIEAHADVPSLKTGPTIAKMRLDTETGKWALQFQPMAPDNPDQETLPFDDERRAAK